jgi:hypothetical protein
MKLLKGIRLGSFKRQLRSCRRDAAGRPSLKKWGEPATEHKATVQHRLLLFSHHQPLFIRPYTSLTLQLNLNTPRSLFYTTHALLSLPRHVVSLPRNPRSCTPAGHRSLTASPSGIFGYINYLVEKDRKYILNTLINGEPPSTVHSCELKQPGGA